MGMLRLEGWGWAFSKVGAQSLRCGYGEMMWRGSECLSGVLGFGGGEGSRGEGGGDKWWEEREWKKKKRGLGGRVGGG